MNYRYILAGYDSNSCLIIHTYGDDPRELIVRYLNDDELFFKEFMDNYEEDNFDYDTIIDHYEIGSLLLIDLKNLDKYEYDKRIFEFFDKDLVKFGDLKNFLKPKNTATYQLIDVIL